MARIFSARSLAALDGVHPALVAVTRLALVRSAVDFTVVEGLRTQEKQRENVARGVSQTMNSKHLKQADGFGHAVDLYPFYDGSVQVNAPAACFRQIADAMRTAADELGVRLVWGGDWKTLVDMPHFHFEGEK